MAIVTGMFSAVEYLFLTIIFFAFVLPCQLLMLVVIFFSFYRVKILCKKLFYDPEITLYQKWIPHFGVIGSEFANVMKDLYKFIVKHKAAIAKEGPKGLKNAGACFKLYVFDTIVAMVISLIGILCFILALTCVVVSFVIVIDLAFVIACTIFYLMEFIDDEEAHFFENNNKPSLPLVPTIRRTVFGPNDSGHETIDIGDGMEIDEGGEMDENDNEGEGDNSKSSENELAAQTNILQKLTKDGAAMERLVAMEILPREGVEKIFLASGKDEGKAFDEMIRVTLMKWFEFYGNVFYIITLNFLTGVFCFIAFLVLSPLWLLTILMLFTTFCGVLFSSKAWKQLFIEGAKPEAEDGEDEEDKDTLFERFLEIAMPWNNQILARYFVLTVLFYLYLPLQLVMATFILMNIAHHKLLLNELLDSTIPLEKRAFESVFKYFMLTLDGRSEDIGDISFWIKEFLVYFSKWFAENILLNMGWIIVYVISGIVTFLCVIIQFPMVIVVFVSGNLLEYYKDMKDPDTGRYSKIFFAVLIPWVLESVLFLIVFPFQLFMTIMICITCIQFKKLMFDLGWCHKRKTRLKIRNSDTKL